MDKVQYLLSDGNAYSWDGKDGVFFRGYFIFKNEVYRGEEAVQVIAKEKNNILKFIKELNGSFSIILESDDKVLLIADKVRSFPLCYRVGEVFSVSDNAFLLKKEDDKENKSAFMEFRESILWLSGEKTLYENIYNVQAGECVVIYKAEKKILRKFYYQFEYSDSLKDEVSREEFWQCYDKVGEEMVKALQGRTAVVPLSGGADSRMIIDLLKKHNYDKVICFTYGDRNSKEVAISKRVAEDRGYQWFFVPYTKKTYHDFVSSGEFYDYVRYASGYTSLPHIQDYYAVKELKNKGVLPTDSVFIPGHSGDMLAGSHITKDFLQDTMTGKIYIDWIIEKFYHSSRKVELRESLKNYFQIVESEEYDTTYLLELAEKFNVQERQAKFIINSVRTYEYFGYEWLIPLWSSTLMDFWSEISKNVRYQRKLYFKCLGNDEVKSTNDETTYSRVSEFIHKFKWLTTIMRKIFRIKEYFTHPWHIQRCVPFRRYMWRVLKSNELFTFNHVVYDLYLQGLGKRGY